MLNTFDGWQLDWVGDKNLCYDAQGLTPKGGKCVVEMKFRKKHYETKMLEKKKYDALMDLPNDVVKIYFVSDPKGSYWYWLDKLKELKTFEKSCPTTSYWGGSKVQKEVYLLKEEDASIVDRVGVERKNVWQDYFDNKK
tara:strand:- start:40 stop:456 length:417 start_codon:yes stop_codon:yes gene_type:complete